MSDKSTQQLDRELKQMEAEMKGTVDINYEKYNTEFIGKVAEHNKVLKQNGSQESDSKMRVAVEEGSKYLHNKAKGRTIYI